jgi:hypothetical protein
VIVQDSFVRRLRLGLGVLVATTVLVLVAIGVSERHMGSALMRSQSALSLLDDSKEVQIQLAAARGAEMEFLLEDLRTPNFFQSGKSPALERHAQTMARLDALLGELAVHPEARPLRIPELREAAVRYAESFEQLVNLQRKRGSLYSGVLGRMREASFSIEDRLEDLPEPKRTELLAEVRALLGEQADYLRDLDIRPRYLVGQRIEILDEELTALDLPEDDAGRTQVAAYREAWGELLEIDAQAGLSSGAGLRGALHQAQETVEPLTIAAVERARAGFETASHAVEVAASTARIVSASAAALAVVLGLFLASSLGGRLRRSLAALVGAVERYASGDRGARVGPLPHGDEFAAVGEAFDRMAEIVAETTEELEEINASLELAVKGDSKALLERIQSLVAERKPPSY